MGLLVFALFQNAYTSASHPIVSKQEYDKLPESEKSEVIKQMRQAIYSADGEALERYSTE